MTQKCIGQQTSQTLHSMITARQRSGAKVMFSVVSVILSVSLHIGGGGAHVTTTTTLTCSNLFTWGPPPLPSAPPPLHRTPPPPDMLKLVHLDLTIHASLSLDKLVHFDFTIKGHPPPPGTCWKAGDWPSNERPSCSL